MIPNVSGSIMHGPTRRSWNNISSIVSPIAKKRCLSPILTKMKAATDCSCNDLEFNCQPKWFFMKECIRPTWTLDDIELPL